MIFKKLVPVFIASVILNAPLYTQTTIEVPIRITDLSGGSAELTVGINTIAVDGIDASLGEISLPPSPPPGGFDARLKLPVSPVEYSAKDYRRGSPGTAFQAEYILQYQPGTGTQIKISWTLPPGVTGLLQDIYTGAIINIDMCNTDTYSVTDPSTYDKLKMTINYPSVIKANIKAMLQGPYMMMGMQTMLNTSAVIPLTQPYNTDPWRYAGTEAVSSIPSGVSDWVLVELRTSIAGTSKVASRAGFIKSSGIITDLDGTSPLSIYGANPGDYYVVVRHRNHLPVMSASAITLSTTSSLFDFTTSASNAFGPNAMKDLGSGVYGMYAGDSNKDGQITALDFNTWNANTKKGQTGYVLDDMSMDGQVTALDFNFWNANTKTGARSNVP